MGKIYINGKEITWRKLEVNFNILTLDTSVAGILKLFELMNLSCRKSKRCHLKVKTGPKVDKKCLNLRHNFDLYCTM